MSNMCGLMQATEVSRRKYSKFNLLEPQYLTRYKGMRGNTEPKRSSRDRRVQKMARDMVLGPFFLSFCLWERHSLCICDILIP